MPDGRCHCSPLQISRYRARVSGPLLDRIDLQVEVPPVDAAVLASEAEGESSDAVLARTTRARDAQLVRGHGPNGTLVTRQVEQYCRMEPAARLLLERSVRKLGLSARACHRVRKVARTLADLEGREVLGVQQVAEAIQLRRGAG
jgi:magnesium chelatase family protein